MKSFSKKLSLSLMVVCFGWTSLASASEMGRMRASEYFSSGSSMSAKSPNRGVASSKSKHKKKKKKHRK